MVDPSISRPVTELKTAGFWYLASPYSHPDWRVRTDRAAAVGNIAASLLSHGIHVYSPIHATHEACIMYELPKDHIFWLNFNKAFIDPAVGVIVATIDGWQESAGVNQEIEYAAKTGKPVYLLDGSGNVTVIGGPEGRAAASRRRMNEKLSKFADPRIKCTILNLRRIASRSFKNAPNWVLVKETFGFGSTYSFALCRLHGLDPEATK